MGNCDNCGAENAAARRDVWRDVVQRGGVSARAPSYELHRVALGATWCSAVE